MTESTQPFLTAAQAAARLGVKQQTLYAYVSRGLLSRTTTADGRRSLFDPADISRLARRGGGRKSAPAEVTVASDLVLFDEGHVFYRGIEAVALSRTYRFEEVACLLWTGKLGWPSGEPVSLLREAAGARRGERIAEAVVRNTGRSKDLVEMVDGALSLSCERGLTIPSLIARLAVSSGASLSDAISAATLASGSSAASDEQESDARIEAISELIADRIRDGRPQATTLPTVLNDLADAAQMPPGTGRTLDLIASTTGWIAHALEEARRPTPFRTKLAYTGEQPRATVPRRTLDAVRDYLARP